MLDMIMVRVHRAICCVLSLGVADTRIFLISRANPGSNTIRETISAVRCTSHFSNLKPGRSGSSSSSYCPSGPSLKTAPKCRSTVWNTSSKAILDKTCGSRRSVLRSRRGRYLAICRQISGDKRRLALSMFQIRDCGAGGRNCQHTGVSNRPGTVCPIGRKVYDWVTRGKRGPCPCIPPHSHRTSA